MTLAQYLKGVLVLGLVVLPWAFAGRAALRALLPQWGVPMRALGAAVVAIGGVIVTAQIVGTFGLFRRIPLALASLVFAGIVVVVARRLGARAEGATGEIAAQETTTWRTMSNVGRLAVVAGCLVVGQWSLASFSAYQSGITDIDSQAYHMPHSAHFVQTHRTSSLDYESAGNSAVYYPANTELLHAVGMTAMHSDVLSTVLNLALLPLGLLAAFCVGRRFGVGPPALVGFAVIATVPLLGKRYAGSAANDFAALAFFLAAAAFALAADDDDAAPPTMALGLAGLAAGLALGTKLTMVVPVVGLTATVVWLARRRLASVVAFVVALVTTGSYWYVRNLVHVGSPVPSLKVLFPSPPMRLLEQQKASVLSVVGHHGFLTHRAPHDLRLFFGYAWPLVLAISAIVLVWWLLRLRDADTPARRVTLGLVLTAGATLATWIVTPTTAGNFHGDPILFVFNIRYALPALLSAFVLLPALPALRQRQTSVAVGGLALMAIAFASPPRLPLRALLIAAILVIAVFLALQLPTRVVVGGLTAAALVVALAGFPLTKHYDRTRFASASTPLSALLKWGRVAPPGAHVALVAPSIIALPYQYAFVGPRFRTRVDYLGQHRAHHEFADFATCGSWRRALQAGDFDFVIATPGVPGGALPDAARWTTGLAGSSVVVQTTAGVVIDVRQVTAWPGC